MNVNHKLELLDQLDDAAFALMMDEYSEAEGERLRAEFEADMRAGLTPPKPEGLDEKCRKQIKAEYGRARRAEYGVRARKMAVKAAAMVLIGIGIAAATVMSVEAIREPFWKAIIEIFDGHLELDFSAEQSAKSANTQSDPFFQFKPEGYSNTSLAITKGRTDSEYTNASGNYLKLDMTYSEAEMDAGIEDENHRYIDLDGYNAFYVTENGRKLFWYDANLKTSFAVTADNLTENEFMLFCKGVAGFYQNMILKEEYDYLNPLPDILPSTYKEAYSDSFMGLLVCRYQSDTGTIISFSMHLIEGEVSFNTEDAVTEEMTILEYDAIYVHGMDKTLIWFDTGRNIMFSCTTFGDASMKEEDFMVLCENLAEYYKNVPLPAEPTIIWP